MYSTLCSKLLFNENKEEFCLTSSKGMLLNENLTICEYGLGVLFFTWRIQLKQKPTMEELNGKKKFKLNYLFSLEKKFEFF